MFERLVNLTDDLTRAFCFWRVARMARNEPGEPFAVLDAAFERLTEIETSEERRLSRSAAD